MRKYLIKLLGGFTNEALDKRRIRVAVEYIAEEVKWSGMSEYEKELMSQYVFEILDALKQEG